MDEVTTTLFTIINQEADLNKQIQAKKEKIAHMNKYIENFNNHNRLKEQNKMLMEENKQFKQFFNWNRNPQSWSHTSL